VALDATKDASAIWGFTWRNLLRRPSVFMNDPP
jgi:hypothetical protein